MNSGIIIIIDRKDEWRGTSRNQSEVTLPYQSYGHEEPLIHDIGIYNIVEHLKHLSWTKNIL